MALACCWKRHGVHCRTCICLPDSSILGLAMHCMLIVEWSAVACLGQGGWALLSLHVALALQAAWCYSLARSTL